LLSRIAQHDDLVPTAEVFDRLPDAQSQTGRDNQAGPRRGELESRSAPAGPPPGGGQSHLQGLREVFSVNSSRVLFVGSPYDSVGCFITLR
jgi:hypothetical protein